MTRLYLGRALLAALLVVPAFFALLAPAASARPSSSTPDPACSAPPVSQVFLPWGVSDWYTPVPGQGSDSFDGTGWTLAGGASIVAATLADGTVGPVLDLPPGSTATSPVMCLDSSEPNARMVTQMIGTSTPSNQTQVTLVSADTGLPLANAKKVLGKPSWDLTAPRKTDPGNDSAENVQFVFEANSAVGDLQIYDFYVDPRMVD